MVLTYPYCSLHNGNILHCQDLMSPPSKHLKNKINETRINFHFSVNIVITLIAGIDMTLLLLEHECNYFTCYQSLRLLNKPEVPQEKA